MNFCFWPGNTSGGFEYDSMTRNLEKILKADPDFFTCQRLSQVNEDYLKAHVFNTDFEFCLLDERARILNEMAFTVQTHFNSSFYHFVEKTNFDAPTFVNQVV